jgi:hypothetical protein
VPKGIPLWTFVLEVLACSPTAFAGNIHSAPGIQEIEPGKDAMPEVATPSRLEVKNSDCPALFQAADRASLAAQRKHLLFTSAVLLCLVIVAGLGALSGVISATKTSLAVASTALASLSFVLTAIRRSLKPEKLWYAGAPFQNPPRAWRGGTWLELSLTSSACQEQM